jgi:hypothetical protein
MALVTCAYCGCKTVDKLSQDYIQYKGKNFHRECGEKQKKKTISIPTFVKFSN